MQYIAFDSHKHYTWACVESENGKKRKEARIAHERNALREFLEQCQPGSPVAVETIGNWYWIVDEIEAAGMQPHLVQARKAKLMMGAIHKTDKLDARGLNQLQRNNTLPTVWIPPSDIRDARELPRTRMVLSAQRTRLKNRIHATLAKYALSVTGVSDVFGKKGRQQLEQNLKQLPPHTGEMTQYLLEHLDYVIEQLNFIEQTMKQKFENLSQLQQIMTLPGVGWNLGVVLLLEIGNIQRFPSAAHLASYAGTVPRVHASGGKVRHGPVRSDVNRYLKWAYVEAASAIARHCHRKHWQHRHVCQLYQRLSQRKGTQKAKVAVARHLAEATYWMLVREQDYIDPKAKGSSKEV